MNRHLAAAAVAAGALLGVGAIVIHNRLEDDFDRDLAEAYRHIDAMKAEERRKQRETFDDLD